MSSEVIIALRMGLVTAVLTGLVYPLGVTAIAQTAFHDAAVGSFVVDERAAVVGSTLIGQAFTHPGYLHGRPSAAGAGYDATASGGSNLGPTSQALRERVAETAAQLVAANPEAPGPVPAELVLASASGLDPHLSPDAALWQAPRIAAARGIDVARVRAIVEAGIDGRVLGVLGEPRVNVLSINLALDRQFGAPARPSRLAPGRPAAEPR